MDLIQKVTVMGFSVFPATRVERELVNGVLPVPSTHLRNSYVSYVSPSEA